MFISETEPDFGEEQFAEDYVAKLLEDWINAGNSPATLLNAMADLIEEIKQQAAMPVH